jgi:hypothetical protein
MTGFYLLADYLDKYKFKFENKTRNKTQNLDWATYIRTSWTHVHLIISKLNMTLVSHIFNIFNRQVSLLKRHHLPVWFTSFFDRHRQQNYSFAHSFIGGPYAAGLGKWCQSGNNASDVPCLPSYTEQNKALFTSQEYKYAAWGTVH